MALVLKDRVKETTTTTGTGTYTLAGAVTGFEAFSSVGDGNTTYYACTDGTDFEVGIGTYTASGTTLARTTILQSSNSDSAVSWSSGTKTIFCAQPAEKAVFLNASDNIELADNEKVVLGTGGDLEIFHSGSTSAIIDSGTGDLKIGSDTNLLLTNAALSETKAKFVTNGAAELYHDNVKKLETTADGVTITSTDAGSSEGPILTLNRDSGSPADNDSIGSIQFKGDNDASQSIKLAEIQATSQDVSDGSEDSSLSLQVRKAGSFTTFLNLSGNSGRVNLQQDLFVTAGHEFIFEGTTDDAHEITLTPGDPTADRTITLPDATGTVLLTDGSGASLTSLNASQLSSGTVPNARLDAQLQDVAGLAVTNGGFIVGDGSNFVLETGSTARTSLGLGSSATADTGISNGNVAVFTSGAADNDFLRIDGTSIEGRSASEVLSDIGATTATAAADEATALAIALG